MTYDNFEQVPVWKKAIELGQRIYRFTAIPAFKGQFSMRDQLERAAVSISNNIAEGFERGTTQELITFLFYAKGSAGEMRSMLALIDGIEWFTSQRKEIAELRSMAESCCRQLGAWVASLQNSPIKGPRYKEPGSRENAAARAKADAFLEKLQNSLPPDHPARRKK